MIYRIIEKVYDDIGSNASKYGQEEVNYILTDNNVNETEKNMIEIAKRKVLNKIENKCLDDRSNVSSIYKSYNNLDEEIFVFKVSSSEIEVTIGDLYRFSYEDGFTLRDNELIFIGKEYVLDVAGDIIRDKREIKKIYKRLTDFLIGINEIVSMREKENPLYFKVKDNLIMEIMLEYENKSDFNLKLVLELILILENAYLFKEFETRNLIRSEYGKRFFNLFEKMEKIYETLKERRIREKIDTVVFYYMKAGY